MALAYYSIDNSKIDAALSNFPVGIRIESSTGFMDGLGADDWENLHATVGGSECYVEVEIWDTTDDEAIIWVRVPTVSATSDTVVKIETGSDNTATYVGRTGDVAAQAVWDSDFVAVYHLSQSPDGGSGCILDSTENENNGTPVGCVAVADLVESGLGKGIAFDGVTDHIDCGLDTTLEDLSQKTIECLFYADGWGSDGGYGRIAKKGANDNDNGWQLFLNSTNTTVVYSEAWNSNSTFATWRPAIGSISLSSLTYLSVRHDNQSTANNPEIDINGSSKAVTETVTPTGSIVSDAGKDLWIGARETSGALPDREFDGKISEFRLSKVLRSDAWVTATSHILKETLLTYSATEPDKETEVGASAGLMIGESADGTITVKNLGVASGVVLSEVAGLLFEKIVGSSESIEFGEVADAEIFYENEGGNDAGFSLGAISGRTFEGSRGVDQGIGFGAVAGGWVEVVKGSSAFLDFGAVAGSSFSLRTRGVDVAFRIGATGDCFNLSTWLSANRAAAVYKYFAMITGAGDGLSDYSLIGLKSIQTRIKSGEPSYLSIVLAFDEENLSALQERLNGEIVIEMAAFIGGVEMIREELSRAGLYSIRYDKGGRSQSITVVGYKTQTYQAGATVELVGVSSETMSSDGLLKFKCAQPDFYLKPGFIATYGIDSITVAEVSCIISPLYQFMEVSE